MRKPRLLALLCLLGLITGSAAGYASSGDFIGASSLAGLAIGTGVLLWMIIAYHLSD